MTRFPILVLAIALAAGSAPALAQGAGGCPPGLAKKAVPCVPPGQARKGLRHDEPPYRERERYHRLRVGDRYDHDRYRYDRIRDYDRWDLPPLGREEGYYRDGRMVYRVDEETRRILALIELGRIITGQ